MVDFTFEDPYATDIFTDDNSVNVNVDDEVLILNIEAPQIIEGSLVSGCGLIIEDNWS